MLPATLGVGSWLAIAAFSLQPPVTGAVAALFPPWWSAGRSMMAAASAGTVMRLGALAFVVIVVPEAGGANQKLRGAGAWLIVDPWALGGCTPV